MHGERKKLVTKQQDKHANESQMHVASHGAKLPIFEKPEWMRLLKRALMMRSISSMSKHTRQKVNRYATELNPAVMKCMAGFSQDDDYFIPRADLLLPG